MFTNLKTKLLLIFIICSNLMIIKNQYFQPDMYIVFGSYITICIAFALFIAILGNKKNFVSNQLAKVFTSLEFH